MKIASPYGVAVRVHPLMLLSLLLLALTGQGIWVCAALLTLALHECGHLFVAMRQGLRVSQIELTPFGGSMQIEQAAALRGWKGVSLAGAGVAVNALCLGFCTLALRLGAHASPFLCAFLSTNLAMLAVNLLPALPLDGGRIALALLSMRFSRRAVFRGMLTLGRVLAGALLALALARAIRGSYQPGYAVLGCYLFYAAALEERCGVARFLTALTTRRIRLEEGRALPLQALCVGPAMPLLALLPELQPGACHLVLVLDGDEIRYTLQEKEVLAAVLEHPESRIGDLIPAVKSVFPG